MSKAVIYCRKSTEWADRQALSIESQLDFCKKMAEEQGIEVLEVITESMSAKSPGRPEFARMMALIEKWKANQIITWKLNRLSRNMIDGGSVSFALSQGIIKTIYTSDGTYTPETNVLLLSVHFWLSSAFSIDLRKDVMRGMATSIWKWNVIQKLPKGYKKDKNTNSVIHTEHASLVRKAFEMRKDKATLQEIRNFLLDNGMKVSKGTVENILKNRFYYGFMLWQGELFKGNYKPIISKELFDSANADKRGVLKKHTFPLKWIIQTEDGKKYLASIAKKKYTYYHRGDDYVSEEELTETFGQYIMPCIKFTKAQKEEVANAFSDYQKIYLSDNIEKRGQIDARLQWLRTRKNNLFDMRMGWEVEKEIYLEKNSELHDSIMKCEEEIRELSQQEDDTQRDLLDIFDIVTQVQSFWSKANNRQKIYVIAIMTQKIYRTPESRLHITLSEPFDTLFQFGGGKCTILELYHAIRESKFQKKVYIEKLANIWASLAFV